MLIIQMLMLDGILFLQLDLIFLVLELLVFLVLVAHAFIRGKRVPDNQWGEGATTLEWTLSSPPPFHQFNVLPKIK